VEPQDIVAIGSRLKPAITAMYHVISSDKVIYHKFGDSWLLNISQVDVTLRYGKVFQPFLMVVSRGFDVILWAMDQDGFKAKSGH